MKLRIINTFECDEKIIDLIIKLHQKGYVTEFCCSGHPGDLNPYLLFNRNSSIDLDGLAPENWTCDRNEDASYPYKAYSIRRKFTLMDKLKYTPDELIDIAMSELAQWIDELEPSFMGNIYNKFQFEIITDKKIEETK